MPVVIFLFWMFGGLILFVIVYLYFLACLSFIPEKKGETFRKPETKFVIIIPAHNEAVVIRPTLESIKSLNYPKELFTSVVVADNCSDGTADIAEKSKITCIERNDPENRGKGFALKWIFDRFKIDERFSSYDFFVIIDADTLLDPEFLNVMDRRIAQGEVAIQGYYDVINPDISPMASLSYFGFVISRNLRFKGRTRLGWSNNLLGNGMCFSKEVIFRYGWGATSIVEDVEYAVMLHLNDIRVFFEPMAKIYAEIPNTFEKSEIQRSRWDIGKFQIRNKYLGQLIKKAIKTRDLSFLDTAMELIIPPFSLFVVLVLTLFGLFLATLYNGLNLLSLIWFINITALLFYIMVGLLIADASWKTYINLIHSPFFLIWRIKTIIWGYFFQIGKHWIKTERK